MKNILKDISVRNTVLIGSLCSVSYLAVYIARNLLSAVTPQMIESGKFTTEYIGTLSSMYFMTYAVGQLINGLIGEKIKARYMISFGLMLAGICNILFPYIAEITFAARIIYGLSGFFLAMIFAPMTKVVAENIEPVHAVRCSLGYTLASFLGSPFAGVLAMLFVWKSTFRVGSAILFVMGALCFILFGYMEKKEIVKYNQYERQKEKGMETGIKVLIRHRIIKFTMISIITGVVRTTVVFWLPTYLTQYLGFLPEQSAAIFTVATFIISMAAFVAIFVYEKLHRNMDLTILLAFISASILFLLVFLVKIPVLNIVLLVMAIVVSNSASAMLWSRYCPSLRDTGLVSSVTGFLDFVSYVAASVSSIIFANAVSIIGWKNLILVWLGLMILGVVISLPLYQYKLPTYAASD